MQVNITFRHAEPTEEYKTYVSDKLNKLKKYFDVVVDSHVILTHEKFRYTAEVIMNANGLRMNAKTEGPDFHTAIDGVFTKLDRQLSRYKEKVRGHKRMTPLEANTIRESVYSYESFAQETEPKIVQTGHYETHPKSVSDAVMEIDLTDKNFLVFTGDDGKVKVVYRREDGDYGLIEPE